VLNRKVSLIFYIPRHIFEGKEEEDKEKEKKEEIIRNNTLKNIKMIFHKLTYTIGNV
jgi:hypothetical protein